MPRLYPTILSLFDYTGEWSRPFLEAGWIVVQMDLKHGDDVRDFSAKWLLENLCQGFIFDGVLAAPPCTDFTRSGARHWAAKDADGRTAASVHLVYQTLRAIDFLQPVFWALENPVGRITKLVPELEGRRFIWDPCDFAGWTKPTPVELAQLEALRTRFCSGAPFSAEDIELVKRSNAYTKRTVLYGDFNLPLRRRLEPVQVAAQGSWLQKLGGKSERTKAERSVTPRGFAQAFFEANRELTDIAA